MLVNIETVKLEFVFLSWIHVALHNPFGIV